ncbi:hypothetical protein [Bradyrhizobium elkanii]|uniref:hypothetical protein n=1 Tax=Bradyrhizobium elkanii TaxID=29448 RepID=UPI002169871F|nr:hypothetical protein [Bradyrhizobium elkanii]MCS3690950.1 hypothetical protein [Bradyrhizobium elkanii]
MAVKTRITSYERSFQLILDRNLSPEARSKRVAAFAQQEIDAADAQNRTAIGNAVPKTVTVDGRQGAPLESVNPDHGTIIAEWRLIGDVLLWIYSTLLARSPVVSGDYQRGHTLYADGAKVDPVQPPMLAGEYVYSNIVPYSRKIEIGKTESGRDFVIQVPNRIYERTADDASKRFGNIAKIRFTYRDAASGAARGNRGNRVPAIVVTLK